MRIRKLMVIGAALIGMFVMRSSADPVNLQVGYSGSSYGKWQTGEGGEFTLTPYVTTSRGKTVVDTISGLKLDYFANAENVGPAGSFQTFCVEKNENIYPYNDVAQGVLSSSAISGGKGLGPTGGTKNGVTYDPLSIGSAWLYKQFALGTLSDYKYDKEHRANSADALQTALWWLEGEITTKPVNNIFVNDVIAKFGSADAAMADNNGTYSVMILHLTYNGQPGQDQLVSYVPDGGTTCVLLGMALTGIGVLRRKIG